MEFYWFNIYEWWNIELEQEALIYADRLRGWNSIGKKKKISIPYAPSSYVNILNTITARAFIHWRSVAISNEWIIEWINEASFLWNHSHFMILWTAANRITPVTRHSIRNFTIKMSLSSRLSFIFSFLLSLYSFFFLLAILQNIISRVGIVTKARQTPAPEMVLIYLPSHDITVAATIFLSFYIPFYILITLFTKYLLQMQFLAMKGFP